MIYRLLLAAFWLVSSSQTNPATTESTQDKDYCKLKGSVYVEKVASFADYKVYLESVESFADLKVYKESSSTFADKPGYWFFTDVRSFADFTIYLESTRSFADFSVHYTQYRYATGCK